MRIAIADMDQRRQVNSGAIVFEASEETLNSLYKLDPDLKTSDGFQDLLKGKWDHVLVANYYDMEGNFRRRMVGQDHSNVELTMHLMASTLGIKLDRLLHDVSVKH